MSSKFNISTFAKEENAFDTKNKALKKATKGVTKVSSQKALKNGSNVRDYYNHPKRRYLSKFGAVEQTRLTAEYCKKHGYECGDEKIIEADASFSVKQSSSNVVVSEQKRLRKMKDNKHPYRCGYLSRFGAVEQTRLTAEYCKKHGYVYYGGDRKDEEIIGVGASFSDEQSSSDVSGIISDIFIREEKRIRKMKEIADLTEEMARKKEERIEDVLKLALSTKATAEEFRKDVEDAEQSLRSGTFCNSDKFLRRIRRTADFAEEVARRRDIRVDYTIKIALSTKATAEAIRKDVEDREKSLKRMKGEVLKS